MLPPSLTSSWGGLIVVTEKMNSRQTPLPFPARLKSRLFFFITSPF